ncbi:MAG: hypothetical protein AAF447_14535, partial [Myxococcota bacterium]
MDALLRRVAPAAATVALLALVGCARAAAGAPPASASAPPSPPASDALSRALGEAEPVEPARRERDVRRPADPGADPDGTSAPARGGVSGAGQPLVLRARTDDPSYGYAPTNPVRVGGAGAARYLAGLWGPAGQALAFERLRSCCLAVAGHSLDLYALSWAGLGEPILLYVDPQEHG